MLRRLNDLVFGFRLDFDFKTRNTFFYWTFFLQYFSFVILRLCTDFQPDVYPGTGRHWADKCLKYG